MIPLRNIFGCIGHGFSIANRATLRLCPLKNRKNHNGFTLIEIVIVIVILGILSSLAALIILQGVRAYSVEDQRSDVRYQAGLAMERMVREIRLIRRPVDVTSLLTDRTLLQYVDINNASMGFRLTAGGQIQRTEDGGTTWLPLAYGITAPGGNMFTYLDNTGAITATQANLWLIQIQFTATQGTESINMLTTLHPMNF